MRNTADVTVGKSIAVKSQPTSVVIVSAVNPLVVFYNVHGRKRDGTLLFYSGHHTMLIIIIYIFKLS
jgi:uncharacterized protein YybS (DUF2232 family)